MQGSFPDSSPISAQSLSTIILNPFSNKPGHYWLSKLFPFLSWWPRVNRATLRADTIAGLTGAIIVLPQGVAFATIAFTPRWCQP